MKMTYEPGDVKEVVHYLRVAYTLMCHLKKFHPMEEKSILHDFSPKEMHAWAVMRMSLGQFMKLFDDRDFDPDVSQRDFEDDSEA